MNHRAIEEALDANSPRAGFFIKLRGRVLKRSFRWTSRIILEKPNHPVWLKHAGRYYSKLVESRPIL